ncbi:cold-shock protein [Chryseobacterium viscerum]|uniref:Cold shock domain-containing protein n=1 Tax=Chryseobacterium viscerum TaxID=1037377 RepID=A0A316WN90_9FLAO|nr:cold shock domain-containing protein [Chryseobacterium viscerum]KAB1231146.1 cold shock domain-containing protein [Chryseobacterium viscerum]PWN62609.1 cold shock domain-containing protein [Chryseobacterium viscerum]
MQKGIVKWYNVEKGYGFIIPEGREDAIFCHHSAIASSSKFLSEGQIVEFRIVQGNKGAQAENVRVVDSN